jgi:hypothetical protein
VKHAASVLSVVCLLGAMPTAAHAWGYEGHKIVAALARAYLSGPVNARIDALLATDKDALTDPDMLSRATWADSYRNTNKATGSWHFVDLELDGPDINAACYGFPAAGPQAGAGVANDCVVNKLEEFERELDDPHTPDPERVLALKYILHFVGDLHQPLHAADHEDQGGNCVKLDLGGPRPSNLHSYWDTGILASIGTDAGDIARKLKPQITKAQRKAWVQGSYETWAFESFRIAQDVTYSFHPAPGCADDRAPVRLPDGYEALAKAAVEVQLERAGVRLAFVLDKAFAEKRVKQRR